MPADEELFAAENDLSNELADRRNKIRARIQKESKDYLLNVDVDEYVAALESAYRVEPLIVQFDAPTIVSDTAAGIPVPREGGDGAPNIVAGHLIRVAIPYSGAEGLWLTRGDTVALQTIRGEIADDEVIFSYQFLKSFTSEDLTKAVQRTLAGVAVNIEAINREVTAFNSSLSSFTRGEVEGRLTGMLEHEAKLAATGFRRRSDTVATYSTPIQRRKRITPKPQISSTIHIPDPTLQSAMYEEVLQTIESATKVLERSPRTFHAFEEEQLRDILLVLLNNLYEGSVTGETFNGAGKTDILVRHGAGNLFIGECKVWKGSKKLIEAVDQLLGYVTWRDTKTAIIVFNKDVGLSSVLRSIPEVMTTHPQFKADHGQTGESSFRYTFKQKHDPEREVTITVLAFTVPNPAKQDD